MKRSNWVNKLEALGTVLIVVTAGLSVLYFAVLVVKLAWLG